MIKHIRDTIFILLPIIIAIALCVLMSGSEDEPTPAKTMEEVLEEVSPRTLHDYNTYRYAKHEAGNFFFSEE